MPSGSKESMHKWWKSIENEEVVSVKYPHERHGLAGKKSNFNKSITMEEFLNFVDLNSQPNGRCAGSYKPTHYFSPKFVTVLAPKVTAANYEQRLQKSLEGEFNRIQEELGKQNSLYQHG